MLSKAQVNQTSGGSMADFKYRSIRTNLREVRHPRDGENAQ